MLNLWILLAIIAAVIESQISTQLLRFLHGIPTLLMTIYISNKVSKRNHLVPKLVKLGLMLCFMGDVILIIDREIAGETLAGGCYFLALAIYCVGMSLGETVRKNDFLFMLFMKLLALIVCAVELGLRYYLNDQTANPQINQKNSNNF